MRARTHRVVAEAACRFLDLSEDRTTTVVHHTMDPDKNLRFMNSFVRGLKKGNPEIFLGERRYGVKDVFSLHTHKKAPHYSLFFASISHKLARGGFQKESDVTMSWAIHYLVDCATPVHASTLVSLKDFLARRHRRYEDHLDDALVSGTLDLLVSLQNGINKGIEGPTEYAIEHAMALTKFSSDLYKPLLKSIKARKISEMEDISHRVFERLGADMAPFLVTFYVP